MERALQIADVLARGEVILTGGSVVERLRRDPAVELHPEVLNAAFVLQPRNRERLATCYRQYLDIGAAHDLPMICCTPTWRANPERCDRAGYGCEELNAAAAEFLLQIRSEYGAYASKVFVGGLIGCRGDAYDASDALGPQEAAKFHSLQAQALARAGVDFLLAVTLPAAPETLGVAEALSACGLPYFLSFIIRPSGALLDGTRLRDIVSVVDAAAHPSALGFWANCVHPTVFSAAMRIETASAPRLRERVLGLQANTSALPPEELEACAVLQTEAPVPFVTAMMEAHRAFGTQILGGCCGTGPEHIEALAQQVSSRQRMP